MLFPEPSNNSGGRKITELVEMEIIDIKPSLNSHSLYAYVIVKSKITNNQIGMGYVSLRAAALREAVILKKYHYVTSNGKTEKRDVDIITKEDNWTRYL